MRYLILLLFLLCSYPALAQADASPSPSATPGEAAQAVEVVVDRVEFFKLYVGAGSFSVNDRAQTIRRNLREVARDPSADLARLQIIEDPLGSAICLGTKVLVVATDRDAVASGTLRQHLAARWLERVRSGLLQVREEQIRFSLTEAVTKTILGGIALYLLARLLSRSRRWVGGIRHRWEQTWLRNISQLRLYRFLRRLAANALTLLISWTWLCMAFAYVVYALGLYPRTALYSYQLTAWLMTPLQQVWHALIDYLPNLFYIVAICLSAQLISSLLNLVFMEVSEGSLRLPGFHSEWGEPTLNILRGFVAIFTLIAVFPYLPGSRSQAFQGVSLLVGLIVSMSSSSVIGNLFAGIVLIYTRAFRIGDRVTIAGTEGVVTESRLLYTRICTPSQLVVTIPNSAVMGGQIFNFSEEARGRGVNVCAAITIGYNVSWRLIHQLLVEAALATRGVEAEPKPYVLQTALNDYHVSYELHAFSRDAQNSTTSKASYCRTFRTNLPRAAWRLCRPPTWRCAMATPTPLPEARPSQPFRWK